MTPLHDPTTIIVHCSATSKDMDLGKDEIKRWHVNERGWDDIGYHYVIRRNGKTELGRSVEYVGAHAAGYNSDSIGICMVGGLDDDGAAVCNFTYKQLTELRILIMELMVRFPTIKKIIGHRDVNDGKSCPCFDVESFLE